jgi:hypothetical protein
MAIISTTVFEEQNIRRAYDEKTETWYFSVVDIVRVLTDSNDYQQARKYWKSLKSRLKKEGSQSVINCYQLKLPGQDGKNYLTDVATPEVILRLVQSIPSPQAEPIKIWLAKVGYERFQEMADPELALNRSRELWKQHGRSDKWIEQRMVGQETRNKLTDYWKGHDIKQGQEYAVLTNIIHKEWSDVSVKEHKALKGLTTQNLRDHMTLAELLFTALAELSTTHIAEGMKATGLEENKIAGKKGGRTARQARLVFENNTGQKVVTGEIDGMNLIEDNSLS